MGAGMCRATEFGTEYEMVPQLLYIKSPNGQQVCAGMYELVPAETVNGAPVWRKTGDKTSGDKWLFSSDRGTWNIGGRKAREKDFQCHDAHIYRPSRHGGVLPHKIGGVWQWTDTDGFHPDPDIAVTVVDSPGHGHDTSICLMCPGLSNGLPDKNEQLSITGPAPYSKVASQSPRSARAQHAQDQSRYSSIELATPGPRRLYTREVEEDKPDEPEQAPAAPPPPTRIASRVASRNVSQDKKAKAKGAAADNAASNANANVNTNGTRPVTVGVPVDANELTQSLSKVISERLDMEHHMDQQEARQWRSVTGNPLGEDGRRWSRPSNVSTRSGHWSPHSNASGMWTPQELDRRRMRALAMRERSSRTPDRSYPGSRDRDRYQPRYQPHYTEMPKSWTVPRPPPRSLAEPAISSMPLELTFCASSSRRDAAQTFVFTRRPLGIEFDRGQSPIVVRAFSDTSVAQAVGVRSGMVLVAINGKDVSGLSYKDAYAVLEHGCRTLGD